ncbi:Hypothetical protein A7982_10394 [Minicystis rosea]|nr:Hypothetical protein A7982_10394 [Minicystis rosea]
MTIPWVNDQRGLIFTINGDTNTVYQVKSGEWAKAANRWSSTDIPSDIRSKVEELMASGAPGAFVRFLEGEDGVYVICEKNIKTVPQLAGTDLSFVPPSGSGPSLSTYDIVIYAKGGPVRTDTGASVSTTEGDYYVVSVGDWVQVVLEEADQPRFVNTTKEMLHLLDALNKKHFLSMKPDPDELRPSDYAAPRAATEGINCYVLNLARFMR